jgi:hypothetical protein
MKNKILISSPFILSGVVLVAIFAVLLLTGEKKYAEPQIKQDKQSSQEITDTNTMDSENYDNDLPEMFDMNALEASGIISKYLSRYYDEVESQYFRWELVSKEGGEITFNIYEPFDNVKGNQNLIGCFTVDNQKRLFEVRGESRTLLSE